MKATSAVLCAVQKNTPLKTAIRAIAANRCSVLRLNSCNTAPRKHSLDLTSYTGAVQQGSNLASNSVRASSGSASNKSMRRVIINIQYNYAGGARHMLEEFFYVGSASHNFAKAMEMMEGDPYASYLGFSLGRRR